MSEKRCYINHDRIYCDEPDCYVGDGWENCVSGKLSEHHEQNEKARHKKAVEIREAIEDYLFDINRYLDIGKYFQKDKGQITKIIKKHL